MCVSQLLIKKRFTYSFFDQKMTYIIIIKYTKCILEQMKRSCIEVGYCDNSDDSSDPLKLFAYMLKEKYGGNKEVEESNKKLLEILIQKRHIPRSSIIWQQDKITKIYGFKVDNSGKIEYDITGSHSPDKRNKTYVANTLKIDMSAAKNAILQSKHASI